MPRLVLTKLKIKQTLKKTCEIPEYVTKKVCLVFQKLLLLLSYRILQNEEPIRSNTVIQRKNNEKRQCSFRESNISD